jgi:hypothetical protein
MNPLTSVTGSLSISWLRLVTPRRQKQQRLYLSELTMRVDIMIANNRPYACEMSPFLVTVNMIPRSLVQGLDQKLGYPTYLVCHAA